jgi:hypothetical protein
MRAGRIAPALYRGINVGLLIFPKMASDDVESANGLRELIRRNETITSCVLLIIAFGFNAAATRSF